MLVECPKLTCHMIFHDFFHVNLIESNRWEKESCVQTTHDTFPMENFCFSGKCVMRSSFISINHLDIWKKIRRMIADRILPCIQCIEAWQSKQKVGSLIFFFAVSKTTPIKFIFRECIPNMLIYNPCKCGYDILSRYAHMN